MKLYPINIIKREEWGALPANGLIPPFDHPGRNVILTMKTSFEECTTKEDCIQKVQMIQKLHMEEWGLPDIAYNFILGNDGNVYEGRGWDQKPQKAMINSLIFDNRTFDIGVIGDYSVHVPDLIHKLFRWLLDYGTQFKLLGPEFLVEPWVDKRQTYLVYKPEI